MIHAPRPLRAGAALLMAVVMLGLTLGVPLLDQGRDPAVLAVADADHAPAGRVDHDHDLCMMYGAAPGSPTGSLEPPVDPAVRQHQPSAATPAAEAAEPRSLHQPRAPPVA